MKKMSASDLNARINKFLDAKKPKMLDLSNVSGNGARRSHRQQMDISDSPFIALAIR